MKECSYELLPVIGLLFTRCDVENALSLSASVWPFFFFAINFNKHCSYSGSRILSLVLIAVAN